jgi:hypothetical protein
LVCRSVNQLESLGAQRPTSTDVAMPIAVFAIKSAAVCPHLGRHS